MGALASRFVDSGNEWATPWPIVIEAAKMLNIKEFDLDPAATYDNRKAAQWFTRQDNGLKRDWFGYVWLNPPFSRPEAVCIEGCKRKTCAKRGFHLSEPIHGSEDFARKAVLELEARRVDAIAWHGPVATDTQWYADLWPYVSHRMDYSGRVRYNQEAQGGTFPSQTLILSPDKRETDWCPTTLHQARWDGA